MPPTKFLTSFSFSIKLVIFNKKYYMSMQSKENEQEIKYI